MELFLVLIIPASTAVLSLLPVRRNFVAGLTVLGALAVLILSVRAAVLSLEGKEAVAIAGWISCDSFGALILLIVAFVGLTAAIFSWGYMERIVSPEQPGRIRRYYSRYNLFLLSMLAVPLFSHLALLWIAVEMTTLLSVFLVSFDSTPEALEAAWKYVVLTCMGAAFALMGILILYWGVRSVGPGPFTWSGLIEVSQAISPTVLKAGFLLILVGFGTKAGLVPMHTWLPDAHSQAPSPICALLSGVETTVVLYVIMRLFPVFHGPEGHHMGTWFVVFGLISVGAAAFLLVKVTDYKRLFAFSTVEHMGIILVANGLGDSTAHFAATLQMVTHAVTKSFCFFAAGLTVLTVGSREIASVRGLIRSCPYAGAALMLAGLAISGAPPFAVFLSEFWILRAAVSSGHYIPAALLVLFIVIAFCGIMLQVNRMVFGAAGKVFEKKRPPASTLLALALAATPVALLGLFIPGPLQGIMSSAAASLGR